MSLNPQMLKLEADKLGSYLRTEPCILFVGADVNPETLPEAVTKHCWSGVITNIEQEQQVAVLFHKFEKIDRTPLLVDSLYAIRANRKDMPIIHLQKICESELIAETDENERIIVLRQTMRDILKKLMQFLTHLFVIGSTENDIPLFDKSVCKNAVFFFGIQQEYLQRSNIQILQNRFGFVFYEQKLGDILSQQTSIMQEEEQDLSDLTLSFYIHNKVVSLPAKEMLAVNDFVELANRQMIDGHIPLGKAVQRRGFERFLEESATDSPIWYAYSKQTGYAVPRFYDDGFYQIVKAALSANKMPNGKTCREDTPIVLMGAPSTGKSVSLGRLAYRIFQDREYPVLFLHSRKDIQGEDLDNLNELMMRITELNPDAGNILLIWDCSSYQNPLNAASRLIKRLNGQSGRKCVLVISSYEHQEYRGETRTQYQWRESGFYECDDDSDADLLRTQYFWILKAPRMLKQEEKIGIQKVFYQYCGLPKDVQWWERFDQAAEADIFNYFFRLTLLTRDGMEKSLLHERNAFNSFLIDRLTELYNSHEQNDRVTIGSMFSDLFAAFNMGGEEKQKDQSSQEQVQKRLREFETCVAAFSQFSLPAPRSLIMSYLLDDQDSSVAFSTDSFSSKLFSFVTTSIPWIVYREIDGDFYFYFRNTQEAFLLIQAELFASNQSDRAYIEFILALLNHYRRCSENGADEKTVQILSRFVREIGPNSKRSEHRLGIQYHEELIQGITDLVNEKLDFGYTFALTLITLRREYYGKPDKFLYQYCAEESQSSETTKKRYENALNELQKTVLLCNQILDDIRSNTNAENNQRGQIINEKALCNAQYAVVMEHYWDNCMDNKLEDSAPLRTKFFITGFRDLFSSMENVIRSDYTNGYYYNTIFRLFETWSKHVSKEAQLEYVGRLLEIASYANSFGVDSGEEELASHIAKFNTSITNSQIPTIAQIAKGGVEGGFLKQYENAILEGNPAYILLIAYQELLNCGIGKKSTTFDGQQINAHQQTVCRSVYNYLKDNIGAIKNSGNALWLILRVFWLMKTKSEPFSRKERRRTEFSREDWKVIFGICQDYDILCQTGSEPIRPFIIYLHALSKMFVQSYANERERFEACRKTLMLIESKDFDFIHNEMSRRMFTPFLLCDETGKPQLFECKIDSISPRSQTSGFMSLVGFSDMKIRFRIDNIGLSKIPDISRGSRIYKDLVIGVGYTGFQAYSESKLKDLDVRARRNNNE